MRSDLFYWISKVFGSHKYRADFRIAIDEGLDEYLNNLSKLKQHHKTRFFIQEKIIEPIFNIIEIPAKLKVYICNRFIDKTHYISTNSEPGTWMEWDWRIFYANFNILVDFIECDKCGMSDTHWQRSWFWRLTHRRDAQAGLEVLNWEADLTMDDDYFSNDPKTIEEAKLENKYGKLTNQAINARIQRDLYLWYTREFPKLLEDTDTSDEHNSMFDKQDKLQELMTEKLISLIKIRQSLWC